jgi:hypothetical protein
LEKNFLCLNGQKQIQSTDGWYYQN